MKSPHTYDKWEYGYFTRDQLEEAFAYRVDDNMDEHEPVFPDGGYLEPVDLYKPGEWGHDYNGEYRSED